MNIAQCQTPIGVPLLIVALGTIAVAGCERRLDASKAPRHQVASTTVTTTTTTTTSDVPSSGRLIGTPPAPPTLPEGAPPETTPVPTGNALRDTPATTPSSEPSKELTQKEESSYMPLPGQPNDHSNVASDGSQRAGQVDPQSMPPRSDLGPNPPQRESHRGTR